MKNLLIITQSVDNQSGVLEFFVGWIQELAPHFNHIDVITLSRGTFHLPDNVRVYSLGKEHGNLKLRRAFRMFALLISLVPQADSVFAHMSPIFAIVAWPFTSMTDKRLVLWYLHRSVTLKLKLATLLCDAIVTADADSLKFKSKKIISIGHGINVDRFKVSRTGEFHQPLRIINISRITPIKNLEVLIQAAGIMRDRGDVVDITIVGAPMMKIDGEYFEQLKKRVTDLNLDSQIHFVGYVPNHRLVEYLGAADISVGLTPSGGIDKVILEAMAAGCIVVTSNDIMAKYLGSKSEKLIVQHGNAADLADKLQYISTMNSHERKLIIDSLVQSAEKNFAVRNFIQRLRAVLYGK